MTKKNHSQGSSGHGNGSGGGRDGRGHDHDGRGYGSHDHGWDDRDDRHGHGFPGGGSSHGGRTIHGGPGDDVLNGGSGNDNIFGAGGNDRISGGGGNDALDGGSGNDHLDGGAGNDRIDGGSGNDTIVGGRGNDTIDGGTGVDVALYSGNFRDYKLTRSSGGGHCGGGDRGAITVHDLRCTTPDGVDVLKNVEILRFADGEYRDGRFYPNGGGNSVPVAVADALAALEDTPLTIPASALTANDTDANGDALRVVAVQAGPNTHGSVVLNNDGTLTFTPDADFSGTAVFTYTVSDGRGGSAIGSVTVAVAAVADTPAVTVADASGLAGEAIALDISASLGDTDGSETLEVVIRGVPQGAVLSAGIDNGDGSWTLSAADLSGLTITTAAGDGTDFALAVTALATEASNGNSAQSATVQLSVAVDANARPVAADDTLAAVEDTPITFPAAELLGNDSDADGDALRIASVSAIAGADVVLNADGTVTFTPHADFNGTASFSYTVTDGRATSAPATVSVEVAAVNDAAVIGGDTAGAVLESGVAAGSPVAAGTLTAADVDDPADTFIASSGSAAYGGFAIDEAGAWSYTLDDANSEVDALNVGGTLADVFAVRSADGTEQQIEILIEGANDAPSAEDAQASGDEDAALQTLDLAALLSLADVDDALDTLGVQAVALGSVQVPGGAPGSFDFTDNGDGTISYDPAQFDWLPRDTHAVATLDVTFTDPHGATVTRTLSVVVAGRNDAADIDPPQEDQLAVTTDSGVNAGGYLVAGGSIGIDDVDLNENVFQTAVSGAPGNLGQLVLQANGLYTYTVSNEATRFLGDGETIWDTFTIRALDGTAQELRFAIHGTSTGPSVTAVADAVLLQAAYGSPHQASGNLLGNDLHSSPSAILSTQGYSQTSAYGAFVLADTGAYSYLLDAAGDAVRRLAGGVRVDDVFSYTASDGTSSDDSTLTVTIEGANDAPEAGDDTAGTSTNTPLTIGAAVLLANDSDIDSDAISVIGVGNAQYVSVALLSGGNVLVTPDADFTGLASFEYTISDGHGGSATGQVSVLVEDPGVPVNQPPVAYGDAVNTDEDTPLWQSVPVASDTDGTVAGYALIDGPAAGSGTVAFDYDGTYTFDPGADFDSLAEGMSGYSAFTYVAIDDRGAASAPATVSITVDGANDAPVAADTTVIAYGPDTATFDFGAFDVDLDDALTFSLSGAPVADDGLYVLTHGTLYFLPEDPSFDYTPNPGFLGEDGFTFTVTDGHGETASATVTIQVVVAPPELFSEGSDTVDFNTVVAGDYLPGSQYQALGGDDFVTLPYTTAAAAAAGYDLTQSFYAGEGNDILVGSSESDVLFAEDGDDGLVGSPGSDLLDGGEGSDSVNYSAEGAEGAGITVILSVGGGSGAAYKPSGVDTLHSIENVIGSGYDDVVIGTDAANRITGGAGSDQLTGNGGADLFVYHDIGDGVDIVTDFGALDGDALDIRDLIPDYDPASSDPALSTITRFAQIDYWDQDGDLVADGVLLRVDAEGTGDPGNLVDLAALAGVDFTATLLNDLIAGGNLLVS